VADAVLIFGLDGVKDKDEISYVIEIASCELTVEGPRLSLSGSLAPQRPAITGKPEPVVHSEQL
jgi:hypothetical protein